MVEYYEDPTTMPVERYYKFNSLMAMSDEVGSTFADMQKRDKSALEYLNAGDIESAKKELRNKCLTEHFLKSGYSPKGTALAAMVKTIDGVPTDDLSEKGLEKTLSKLSRQGLTKQELEKTTERLKKKSIKRFLSICRTFLNLPPRRV